MQFSKIKNKIKEFLKDFIYGITRSATLDPNGIEMTLPHCYASEDEMRGHKWH